ncbi:MAG TPA: hypothetical protein ENK33_00100 [Desulfobacterales bacterium]|nr:hypothetical protein [Desulfobacterales bacterium]
MIYIHATGIHNTIPTSGQPDLRAELKAMGADNRRSDHFMRLAVIGAHKAADGHELPAETAVYMTSGQGNTAVFNRICSALRIEKNLPKPVDFINLLSNSTGFYIASHLGLAGRNIFLTHHHFPVQMTLLTAQNDITQGLQQTILAGGVDEWQTRPQLARKLMGIEETTVLGEGSNWLLLSPERENALAVLEVEKRCINEEELTLRLRAESKHHDITIAFAPKITKSQAARFMNQYPSFKRHNYEAACAYYETLAFYALNSFIAAHKKGRLLHIDCGTNGYMLMTVEIIP